MASSIFTGASRYSTDFASVIERAVKIASLPMNQMQSQLTGLQSDSGALSTLDGKMAAVQSAISNLEAALGTSSYSATVSHTDLLSATLADGVKEGSYHVTVKDIGAYPLAVSGDAPLVPLDSYDLSRVFDPTAANLSIATNYTLTIGTGNPISLTATTLQGLADQIQSKAGDQVTATVVNI